MELTEKEKERLEFIKKMRLQGCAIMQEEKSSDYYEGFYDGIQAILKIIKGA
jgi:hypothetical protein